MEMKNELPPANYTPEEQAQLEKSRTISDAELLKRGAEYNVDTDGEKRLEVTDTEVVAVKEYANRGDLEKNIPVEQIENYHKVLQFLEEENIYKGDRVRIRIYGFNKNPELSYEDIDTYVGLSSHGVVVEENTGAKFHGEKYETLPNGQMVLAFDRILRIGKE